MDEAGPKTQTPFKTTSTVQQSDPDVSTADTVTEPAVTSSRTRYGSSHSTSMGADWEHAGTAAWASAEKSADDTTAETSAQADTAGTAENETGQDAKPGLSSFDRTPSFTPSYTSSSESSTAGSSSWSAAPSYSAPDYTSTDYTSTETSAGSGWSRGESAWPGRKDGSVTAPVSAPAQGTTAPTVASDGRFSSTSATNAAASAAAAVSGAAAGLAGYASSMTSAWQKRSAKSKRKPVASAQQSGKRQAALTLTRLEPWSVMKFSFMASVVAFIILFVAVAMLYMTLSALGVFGSLQHTISSITSSQSSVGTNLSHWFSASLILSYTAMLGAMNIVLITALATIGSVIYNLIAKTVGGIEVTLKETE